jgi:hypothetical protein
MLQIWLDESGENNPPVFVLAGYLHHAEKWPLFADEWQKLLAIEPKLNYIKSYEAFGLRDQFKGWTEDDRDKKLMDFVQIIEHYTAGSYAFIIEHENFREILQQKFPPFKSPYTFCYAATLYAMVYAMNELRKKEDIDDKIELIFDQNLRRRKSAAGAYKDMLQLVEDEVAQGVGRKEPRFEDDKEFMPLQAADLLAYCMRVKHDADRRHDRVRRSPVYKALESIPRRAEVVMTKQMMNQFRSAVEKRLRLG